MRTLTQRRSPQTPACALTRDGLHVDVCGVLQWVANEPVQAVCKDRVASAKVWRRQEDRRPRGVADAAAHPDRHGRRDVHEAGDRLEVACIEACLQRVGREAEKIDAQPRHVSLVHKRLAAVQLACLLYTSDAADDTPCVDLG
eukprot:356064-Chlamydomonas_euryale.AAC.15